MLQVIYFVATGIVIYVISDWILDRIEMYRGTRFENRNLIFFFIFLLLALVCFGLLSRLLAGG